MDESNEKEISGIETSIIPDNSITLILKAGGKVYSKGAHFGEISQLTPDEDLDSVLRAMHGLGISLMRTVAIQVAGRDEAYPLPTGETESQKEAEPVAEVEVQPTVELKQDEDGELTNPADEPKK